MIKIISPEIVNLISTVCEQRLFSKLGCLCRTHADIADYMMIGRRTNPRFFNPEQLKQFQTYVMACETVGSSSKDGYLFMMTVLQNDATEKYRVALFDILGNEVPTMINNTSGVIARDNFWKWFTEDFDQLEYYTERIQEMQRMHARRASECADTLDVLTIKQGDI